MEFLERRDICIFKYACLTFLIQIATIRNTPEPALTCCSNILDFRMFHVLYFSGPKCSICRSAEIHLKAPQPETLWISILSTDECPGVITPGYAPASVPNFLLFSVLSSA